MSGENGAGGNSGKGGSSRRGGRKNLRERVKTARGRRLSSTRWLERQLNDPYVLRAKEGIAPVRPSNYSKWMRNIIS